ncbi:putative MYND domain protein [Mariannaea sp. PMI_226]|nr:putative MYND domain protein [Mariannaea sp. PMI_226]
MSLTCTICKKTSNETDIKRCGKCSETPYCSRECQGTDWKRHKKGCGKPPPRPGSSPPKSVDQGISQPFTNLERGNWLHGRSEKDTYRLLLDAYRLRTEDDYNLEQIVDEDGLYSGNPNSLPGFKRFLDKAEQRPDLLPAWWNAEKRRECEAMGLDESVWQTLTCKIEKSDIIEHYGDGQFPMQLRLFAEAVVQRGPGGQSGATMRKLMADMEQGKMEGMSMAHVDATTGSMRGSS